MPANLARFDPLEWGADGDAAVDRWKYACLDYLGQHPDRSMPFGEHGDVLSVIRGALRLKGAYDLPTGEWLGPETVTTGLLAWCGLRVKSPLS